jgi:hypothetical protein
MKTVKELCQGTATLAYWWLEGHPPVAPDKAQDRAKVCQACPMNLPEGMFKPLTAAVARAAAKLFSAWWKMDLHVEGEEGLQTCEACGCELKLKVWAPRKVIFRNGDVMGYYGKLHADCWIRKESERL